MSTLDCLHDFIMYVYITTTTTIAPQLGLGFGLGLQLVLGLGGNFSILTSSVTDYSTDKLQIKNIC